MTRLLSLFGLMRVSEHERSVRALESQLVLRENAFEAIEGERDRLNDKCRLHLKDAEGLLFRIAELREANNDWQAKFKRAATDLAAQAAHIEDWRAVLERMETDRDNWRGQALRDAPDALAMRRKRQMDRDRRKGR